MPLFGPRCPFLAPFFFLDASSRTARNGSLLPWQSFQEIQTWVTSKKKKKNRLSELSPSLCCCCVCERHPVPSEPPLENPLLAIIYFNPIFIFQMGGMLHRIRGAAANGKHGAPADLRWKHIVRQLFFLCCFCSVGSDQMCSPGDVTGAGCY